MKPSYCVDGVEYKISKIVLDALIRSVTDFIGRYNADKIMHFICEHVLVHEDMFLFYKRKCVRHFDESSNSCHEGSNHGTKSCAGKVLPNYHIDKSVSKLCRQGVRNSARHNIKVANEVNSTKQWSSLNCANKLISHGLGLLEHQWESTELYDIVKVQRLKWLLLFNGQYKPSIIPRFMQTYKVTSQDGVLYCTCKHFERHGIPCRHQLAVLKSIPGYKEPTHHDVSICWWLDYQYKDISNETEDEELCRAFDFMERHDIQGPSFTATDLENVEIDKVIDNKFNKCLNNKICSNYKVEGIELTSSVFGTEMQSNVLRDNAKHIQNNLVHDDSISVHAERQSTWDQLYPHFKDLVSCVKDIEDATEIIDEVTSFMEQISVRVREEQAAKFLPMHDGKYISINVLTEKKRKTHGTDRYN